MEAQMLRNFFKKLAIFFGVGLAPFAPGTAGTLAALPLVFFLAKTGPLIYMIVTIIMLPVGIIAAEVYEQDKGGHDHKEIVIDEVLGIMIAMTWLPITWQSMLIGFVLFRVLDIAKPFPIGYIDKKIQGGLGVMADDVAAGIVVNICMQLIYTHTSWLGVQQVLVGL